MTGSKESDIVKLAESPAFSGGLTAKLRVSMLTARFGIMLALAPAFRRAFEIAFSSAFLIVLAPVFSIISILQGPEKRLFATVPRVGRWGEIFNEYLFLPEDPRLQKLIKSAGLTKLAVMINVLRGDMTLVGPRAMNPEELTGLSPADLRRMDVKPGLLCLWWIRMRSNVGYDGEIASDIEYAETHSIKKDLGILARAVPAWFFGTAAGKFSDNISLLDIPITNLTMQEAIDRIIGRMSRPKKTQICFVNADCANIAWNNPQYMAVLHKADLNFADGIGLKLGGKIIGQEIRQNVNGTDLFPRLMKTLEQTGQSVFFLGARPEVSDALVGRLRHDYPQLKIAGARHGYFAPAEEETVLKMIDDAAPDLLLVAFGAPKQDIWIAENLPRLSVKLAMGVGGLFDFFSGTIPRAPVWMREIGLEWLYRFIQEPRRMWRRYFIGNFVFIYRILKSRSGAHAPALGLQQEAEK